MCIHFAPPDMRVSTLVLEWSFARKVHTLTHKSFLRHFNGAEAKLRHLIYLISLRKSEHCYHSVYLHRLNPMSLIENEARAVQLANQAIKLNQDGRAEVGQTTSSKNATVADCHGRMPPKP